MTTGAVSPSSRLCAESPAAATFDELLAISKNEIAGALGYPETWLFLAGAAEAGWHFVGDAELEPEVRPGECKDSPSIETDESRTVVHVPLRLGMHTIGLLGAGDPQRGGAPDAARIDYLLGMASQLEVAVGRIRAAEHDAAALELSERRFRGFKDSGIIGIVLADTAGNIKEANDAFLAIVGYTRADLEAGLVSGKVLNVADRMRTDAAAIEQIRLRGFATPWEKELVRKDGTRVPVLMGVVMIQESIQESVAFALDLTERKAAEAAARRSEDDRKAVAREAEMLRRETAAARMANEELEAFSYSVAHDLRSPLRAISGFSDAILDDHGSVLDDAAKKLLSRVIRNAERMGLLIDALLSLARLSRAELRRTTVDLSHIAKDIVESLRATEPDRIVEVVVPDGIRAYGDPQLLHAVLENLLGNAWKFTKGRPGAKIILGSAPLPEGPSYWIRDNGAGFDMAYAPRLFTPFQRLHTGAEFEGTGIGLATVGRIIRRHGGRVWAIGEENEGATFNFTLP